MIKSLTTNWLGRVFRWYDLEVSGSDLTKINFTIII